ncbi:MAG TPA: aconitase family protein, partial [Burkholderiales bacterium]|nr:aconitase family protein [Burkholderiales bacterium]
MGMTIAEKILAKKGGRKSVAPGDLVTVEVDTVVMIDNSFIASRWREIQKVRDSSRIVVVFDHRAPASTEDAAAAHRTGRRFVEKFGIRRFHDVGYDQGISHQLVADHGYALPGTILVCSDSHTCSGGVFNCIARGVGEPDVVYSAIKGETWFRVGDTVRYELFGKLSPAVTTKDAFLQIAGQHGDHATQNIEW